MHKLLALQLKKCFGPDWALARLSPEINTFIEMVDQTYAQYDEDYRMLEHVLDVNSRELSESIKEVKEKHELLHNVTESVRDLIFYKDLEFKYIGCNHSFACFFGRSEEEFMGKDDYELFSEEYASLFREMDLQMIAELKPRTNTEWVKDAEGNDALLLTTKTPLINARGEVFGLVGVARDITKEHILEEEIKSQQAMLIHQARFAAMGEMIGNIAHQWRQPLNTLGLIVQDIEEAYRHDELDEAYVQGVSSRAMDQINFMSRTIDDFRNFFNPNKERKPFLLSESIDSTVHILAQRLRREGIRWSVSVSEGLLVCGYRNEFTQVLFNLIKNAKDALVENRIPDPKIEIEAVHSDQRVIIEVRDNAGGIDEAIKERIFDPYFTTKEEGKGTGIGLYMSKMIIEEHMGGMLHVEAVPGGSSFVISISRHEKGDDESGNVV